MVNVLPEPKAEIGEVTAWNCKFQASCVQALSLSLSLSSHQRSLLTVFSTQIEQSVTCLSIRKARGLAFVEEEGNKRPTSTKIDLLVGRSLIKRLVKYEFVFLHIFCQINFDSIRIEDSKKEMRGGEQASRYIYTHTRENNQKKNNKEEAHFGSWTNTVCVDL